jgi:Mlc titration factor MtfA (ptsG expression regulator)
VRDPGTRGESFAKSKTVGMYDAGATASQFPTGMQQFRGTFAHELAHALIEDVKNKAGEKTIQKYAVATGVWTSRNVTPYQSDTSKKTWDAMKAAGKEAPVTPYGATNAGEDLADAIKYLFEDPAKLKTDCPIRYRWILQNLGTFFESTWFAGLPAAPP